jgi:hypothetical protein
MKEIISSEQLNEDRKSHSHTFQWSTKALHITDEDGIKKLAQEIDSLASDNSKNEKIAVQFRSLLLNEDGSYFKNEKGEMLIEDVSVFFERNHDDSLLDGKNFLTLVKGYSDYIKSLSKNLSPEVAYCYYALDLTNNKKEEHNVETFEDRIIPLKKEHAEAFKRIIDRNRALDENFAIEKKRNTPK